MPLACDLTAIPLAERPAHQQVTRRLAAAATAIRESGEGFTFHLSADDYDTASQFVARERLCCPFLKFVIVVEQERGSLELRMTGPAGAKEFIRAELKL